MHDYIFVNVLKVMEKDYGDAGSLEAFWQIGVLHQTTPRPPLALIAGLKEERIACWASTTMVVTTQTLILPGGVYPKISCLGRDARSSACLGGSTLELQLHAHPSKSFLRGGLVHD